ncbi:MAG: hypothetical protein O4860_02075 [Trichodesmium sp. St2_bin2_1]|nr:hypothetical protein [Trichodesmium sp. St2_bin2_1]
MLPDATYVGRMLLRANLLPPEPLAHKLNIALAKDLPKNWV